MKGQEASNMTPQFMTWNTRKIVVPFLFLILLLPSLHSSAPSSPIELTKPSSCGCPWFLRDMFWKTAYETFDCWLNTALLWKWKHMRVVTADWHRCFFVTDTTNSLSIRNSCSRVLLLNHLYNKSLLMIGCKSPCLALWPRVGAFPFIWF